MFPPCDVMLMSHAESGTTDGFVASWPFWTFPGSRIAPLAHRFDFQDRVFYSIVTTALKCAAS